MSDEKPKSDRRKHPLEYMERFDEKSPHDEEVTPKRDVPITKDGTYYIDMTEEEFRKQCQSGISPELMETWELMQKQARSLSMGCTVKVDENFWPARPAPKPSPFDRQWVKDADQGCYECGKHGDTGCKIWNAYFICHECIEAHNKGKKCQLTGWTEIITVPGGWMIWTL